MAIRDHDRHDLHRFCNAALENPKMKDRCLIFYARHNVQIKWVIAAPHETQ